jgi:hypothetical protein
MKKQTKVKDKMKKFYYLCTGFSLLIWQQQKHLLSYMMKSQFPNLNALPKYVGHLPQKPNVELQNFSRLPIAYGCSHA